MNALTLEIIGLTCTINGSQLSKHQHRRLEILS